MLFARFLAAAEMLMHRGTRINDHDLSLAEKQAARAKVAAGKFPAAI